MPTVTGASVVTLKIDGVECSARDDQSVLDVAREHNLFIPSLCNMKGLSSPGSCRLCLVEVKGQNALAAACVTKVTEGMEVRTTSPLLESYRRMTLEMLFVERNHVCSVCVANGRCELQDLAVKLGVDHVELQYLDPKVPVDASHPRFFLDHNRCVLCQRCVRVCDEIEGAHVWDLKGRGIETRVGSGLNSPWGEDETCTSCGKCVAVCPTGALSEKGRAVGEKVRKRPFLPYLRPNRPTGPGGSGSHGF